MRRTGLLFLVAASVVCVCFLHDAHRNAFVLVAVHPDAATQPTSTGRVLIALSAFHGKVFAGYGDYGANTGPIAIRALDPAGEKFGPANIVAQTEAIHLFRQIRGRLYAPHIDPAGHATMGGYSSGAETWEDCASVECAHIFDVATLNGVDLWLAGAAGNDAVAWRSLDNGQTWSVAVRESPTSSPIARYYGIGIFNGKLYLQKDEPGTRSSKVFDGKAWSDGPNLLPPGGFLWRPESFAGQMVYMTRHAGISFSPLYCFDGIASRLALNPTAHGETGAGAARGIYDFTVADRQLFALGIDHLIRVTDDLDVWRDLANAPADARSICVLGNDVFLGGTDAKMYRLRLRSK